MLPNLTGSGKVDGFTYLNVLPVNDVLPKLAKLILLYKGGA